MDRCSFCSIVYSDEELKLCVYCSVASFANIFQQPALNFHYILAKNKKKFSDKIK